MRFTDRIRPYKSIDLTGFVRVLVDGYTIGWTQRDFANLLDGFDTTWQMDAAGLHLNPAFDDYDSRTRAIDDTFTALSVTGHIPTLPDYSMLGGIDWFPVCGPDRSHLAVVKRFFAPYLGICWENILVNGYYGDHYWVPQRSRFVDSAPGMLDILVAGAVRHDQTKEEALYDEGLCEAGITPEWHPHLRYIRTIHLYYPSSRGFLVNELFHLYDFDTQGAFTPETRLPAEVESITAYPVSKVMEMVLQGAYFKPQTHLVIIDFLLRHNHIGPDHPEYDAIRQMLDEEKDFS